MDILLFLFSLPKQIDPGFDFGDFLITGAIIASNINYVLWIWPELVSVNICLVYKLLFAGYGFYCSIGMSRI
jgi:hypothetical protein